MKFNVSKITIVSIAFNILIILFFIGKRLYLSYHYYKESFQWTDNWNAMRSDELSTVKIDTADIIFVGTSLTEGFPLSEIYHSLKIKNFGIAGNYSREILARIVPIASAQPSKIFIECGINDIKSGLSNKNILNNYDSIIGIIKQITPTTKIYIQSIFPTNKPVDNLNVQIKDLNELLFNLCRVKKIIFINIYNDLGGVQGLDQSFTLDGIHLNSKGYAVWKKHIDILVD